MTFRVRARAPNCLVSCRKIDRSFTRSFIRLATEALKLLLIPNPEDGVEGRRGGKGDYKGVGSGVGRRARGLVTNRRF